MTVQELAAEMHKFGLTTFNRWAIDGAAMLRKQAEQIEALKADEERLFILASTIKRDGYDWYIPEFFVPCENFDKRNHEPGMKAIRAAIDAMEAKT